MNNRYIILFYGLVIAAALIFSVYYSVVWKPEKSHPVVYEGPALDLPKPRYSSNMSVEEALLNRRSKREYLQEALTLEEISQLLWSAQGVTGKGFLRTAPSAGGTYPLEVYLVAGNVSGIEAGIYHYIPEHHRITKIGSGDYRKELEAAAGGQRWVGEAAADIVIIAVYDRTTSVYGERGIRYVHLEAGHAAQNIYLQATALGLGTVAVGAFDDNMVSNILNTTEKETPLYIMPLGRT